MAPTAIAPPACAGEVVQASSPIPSKPPLPAATAKVMPALTALFTAASTPGSTTSLPRLMFATAGLTALAATQSMPATTVVVSPLPSQPSTRTATSCTCLATPKVVPPTVPATWVPCPSQSLASVSLSKASIPDVARPPKSGWLNRIPVSMMYACTFAAVDGYVYEWLSGRAPWSIRSRPHDGGLVWVSLLVNLCTAST